MLSRLAVAALVLVPGVTAADERPLTVVELFTSQGCSSCPPADAFLGELATREDVLALSVHVDYWDYIGWKDPFALPGNTQRQRAYAKRFGLPYVYTPQMVVHGRSEAAGSDRSSVLELITAARPQNTAPVKIRSLAKNRFEVDIGGAAATEGEAGVWLVLFDDRHTTEVKRGENGGRLLNYYNVVRSFKRIGTWQGQPLTIPVTMDNAGSASDSCAIIIQAASSGHILGAAKLRLNDR